MPTLSEILKSKIGKGKIPKSKVALELEVTEKTIENYMNGKRAPTMEGLMTLSKLLKFELNDLSEHGVLETNMGSVIKNEKSGAVEPDFKAKYIDLLEKRLAEIEAKNNSLNTINSRLTEIERLLNVVRNNQLVVFSVQFPFQRYVLRHGGWGSPDEEPLKIVVKESAEFLQNIQKEGIHF